MDELQASAKFADSVVVQTGFHHYEVNRSLVPSANAPGLASAIGFNDGVAIAAQNQ
jgi:hypothetical protein